MNNITLAGRVLTLPMQTCFLQIPFTCISNNTLSSRVGKGCVTAAVKVSERTLLRKVGEERYLVVTRCGVI